MTVKFGAELSTYTAEVKYNTNLLKYLSVDDGTANDNGQRVKVSFYDTHGGSNTKNSMTIKFQVKDDFDTSNSTGLSFTADSLAGPDASPQYEDISTPLTKTILVEPEFIDYDIDLNYSGDIMKNEEKDMKLVVSSSMGKYYEHTRITAEATTPENETVKIIGVDEESTQHDLITEGWGAEDGDPIGGRDVIKELNFKGLFSGAGDYSIKLKLVNLDDSSVIANKDFKITVKGDETENSPENTLDNNINNETVENTEKPNSLPKTGNTIYFMILPIIVIIVASYFYLKKED